MRSANPSWGVGDVAKELGRRWEKCVGADRKKYETLNVAAKAKYQKVNHLA